MDGGLHRTQAKEHRVVVEVVEMVTALGALAVLQAIGTQLTAGHLAATTVGGALFGAALAWLTN